MKVKEFFKDQEDHSGETTEERRARLLKNRTVSELLFSARLTDAEFHFDEQVPIGPYFADFLVAGKTVVELDGEYHLTEEQQEYDARRDRFMRKRKYRVIRITNTASLKYDLNLLAMPHEVKAKRKKVPKKKKAKGRLYRGIPPAANCPRCGRHVPISNGLFVSHRRHKGSRTWCKQGAKAPPPPPKPEVPGPKWVLKTNRKGEPEAIRIR